MNSPTFWNDQEKAKEVIQELKTLNAVLKPFEELVRQADNLEATIELAEEAETDEFDDEIRRGLQAGRGRFQRLRVPLDAGRSERPLQRLRDDPRRRRRHRGVRLGRDAPAHVPDVGRVEALHHPRSPTAKTAARPASRRRRSTSRASTPTATSAARRASIGWSGSARSTPPHAGTRRSPRSTSCPKSTTRSTSCSRDDDLKRDVFRSGGPGGQHQNKTESGVRYTHLPTGVAAESRSERSQHKNDTNALALLKAKLIRLEEEKREAEFAKKYDEKGEVSFGNQIRSYVLQPYQIVKDLRTDYEVGNPRAVLDGDIDGFIEAYLRMKLAKGTADLARA